MNLLAKPILRVSSALLSNLSIVWIAAIFIPENVILLLRNMVAAIVCVLAAITVEFILENYEF